MTCQVRMWQSEASLDNLSLHCQVAREMWSMVFGLFGVRWVMPRSVLDLLTSWLGKLGRHRCFVIWRVVPHCVL